MSPRVRFGVAACVVIIAIAGLIGFSLAGSTAYYRTPAELLAGSYRTHARVRVAGVVVKDSIVRKGAEISFVIQEGRVSLPVTTDALLPDTFSAGVTVVAEGAMSAQGVFAASDVLAKCPSKFSSRVSS
jgi:cytochrome c-type biogenesis protein CcmE